MGSANPITADAAPAAPAASGRLRSADRLGAALSLLCALHCALLPVVFALLPSIGLGVAGEVGFERGFTLFATVLALVTLVAGYRRHRAFSALLWVAPGLAMVWLGAFGPVTHLGLGHALLMTAGGTLIGAAHLVNLRLARRHVHGPACAHGRAGQPRR